MRGKANDNNSNSTINTKESIYPNLTVVVAAFESPLSDFSGGFGFVTITTINFFSSMLYSDRAVSSVSILPETNAH